MPDTTNVIEVDFTRKTDGEDVGGLATKIANGFAEVRAEFGALLRSVEWERRQRLAERRRRREIEKELLHERGRNFPFSDEAVLAALRRVYDGDPVAAGVVARELAGAEPTQSARIRTGHALSRLAKSGRVIQHPPEPERRITFRWGVTDV